MRLVDRLAILMVALLGSTLMAGPAAMLSAQEAEQSVAVPEAVDFVADIKPIFETQCLKCHGPDKEEAFRIDDRDATLDYISDTADDSELFEYLISEDEEEMMPPPDEGGPLAENQIELIRRWIDDGADWPEGVTLTKPVAQETQLEKKAKLSMGERIWSAIGDLHPAAVHMPIGLLLAAGLFSLLGLRGNFVMSDSAYYCLWLGALTAVAAAVFGWSYAQAQGSGIGVDELTNTESKFFLHRVSGVAVTVFAILLALYAARARALDPDDGFLWKLGAIILAIGVGYCGHEGGKLQYPSHYAELNAVTEDLTGMDLNSDGSVGVKKAVEEDRDGPASPSQDNAAETNDDATNKPDAKSAVGATSEETGTAEVNEGE